jgi:hypothetical protein
MVSSPEALFRAQRLWAPRKRVLELVKVLLLERGPQRLGELIIGPRMQQTLVRPNPRVVVAVNHFAQQNVLGIGLSAGCAEVTPEAGGELVGDVEAPPVNTNLGSKFWG